MNSPDVLQIVAEVTTKAEIIAAVTNKGAEIHVQVLGAGPKGAQGDVGPQGPQGVQGPPGETYIHPATHPAEMIVESADRVFLTQMEKTSLLNYKENFVHRQSTAASIWYIQHGLGKFPAITVVDSAGSSAEGTPEYVNSNYLILRFSAAFSGVAYLS